MIDSDYGKIMVNNTQSPNNENYNMKKQTFDNKHNDKKNPQIKEESFKDILKTEMEKDI